MNRKRRRNLASRTGSKAAAESLGQAIGLQQQGQLDAAERLYRQILRQNPEQVDALHFLGVLAAQRGRYPEAVDLIRRALVLNPKYADACNNLGNVLAAMERLDEAAEAYRRAIDLAPGNASAHCNLGAMLRRTGRFAEAEVACRQAIALNPRLAEAHFNLAKALTALDRYEDAVAAYREAIRLRPGHVPAYRSLGMLLYRLGRGEEAADLYRLWLERDPANPVARHMLAAHSGCDVPLRAADDYVQKLFDGMADDFDSHLVNRLEYRAPELVARAVAAAAGEPKQSLAVLDAGCGTGLCGPLLRPYAAHLAGVDLSPRMVEKARAREDYHELVVAELNAFLRDRPAAYDLIVSADTLVYFGELETILTAAAGALRPNGWLVFTVERCADSEAPSGFHLDPSGRYSHSEPYLLRMLAQTGMTVGALEEVVLRMEGGQPVAGLLVSAHRPPVGGEI
ncbi:MAG TPA: tetratricopeptide repeat protein [Candidatus Competibacter sp.]|nr:tetratricopeptide repeat protein [Candidatus Competibacter sp.]